MTISMRNLMNLDLHETVEDGDIKVTRVPGGLIYLRNTHIRDDTNNSEFVPFTSFKTTDITLMTTIGGGGEFRPKVTEEENFSIKNDPNVVQDQRLDDHDRAITQINTRIDRTNNDVNEVNTKAYLARAVADDALDKAKTARSYSEDALGTSVAAWDIAKEAKTTADKTAIDLIETNNRMTTLERAVDRLVPR